MQRRDGTPRPGWLVVGLLLILAVTLLGSAGAYQVSRIPGVAEQLPPDAAPLVVAVSRPADGSAYPANAFIAIVAQAAAARPLAALELWADGVPVGRQEVEAGSARRRWVGFWSWQPVTVGDHVLVVRAVDAAGIVGQSAPVRVRATAAADARLLITAQEGDTLESLASLAGTSLEGLAALNPELATTEPLAASRTVFAPLSLGSGPAGHPGGTPTPAPPSGPTQWALEAAPSKVSLWLRKRALAPARPPLPPLVTAVAQDCDVRLVVADKSADEQGFFVYRLVPGADRFDRIATLAANSGTLPLEYVDRDLGGHVEYYVSSFNAAGESPSNVYAVDVGGPGCLPSAWWMPAGRELWLEGGKLVVSQPVDKVYSYLALDDGPWTRVPADPQEFVAPLARSELLAWARRAGPAGPGGLLDELSRGSRRAFDLAAALGRMPPLEDEHTVALEVWGWKGDELLHLLSLRRPVRGSELAGPGLWLSSHTGLAICGEPEGCREGSGWADEAVVRWDEQVQVRELSWATDVPGATGVVWQLSSRPFSEAFEPSPPGLVAAGALGGVRGTFRIDLAALLQPPLEHAGVALQARPLAASIGNGQPLSLVFGGLGAAASPGSAEAGFPRTYYLRVTPMAGNRQAGAPSGTVAIHYGPSEEGASRLLPSPAGIYELHIAEFRPAVFPRSELWGCVRITRNDRYTGQADSENPDPWSTVPAGTAVCPEVYEGEGEQPEYQRLWEATRGATAAHVRSGDVAAQALAAALPGCDEGCRARLSMGLEAGLATAGLPARLPSLDALTERGQAYLAGLLAAQVGAGSADDSECMAAIEQGLGALKEAAAGGGYNAACTSVEEARRHGREPLCLPSGVVGTPLEGSEYVPAMLVVQVTRRPQPVDVPESDYGRYVLRVSATATNTRLVGQSIVAPSNTYVVNGVYAEDSTEGQLLSIDKPLEGDLFHRVEQTLPRLRPGETVLLPIELQAGAYWVPGHAELIQEMGGYVHYDDWLRLYSEGRATFRASIDCYTTLGWSNCGVDGHGWEELQVDLPALALP